MHRFSFEIRRFPFAFTLEHRLKILLFWSWWMSIRAARRQPNHAAMRIRAARRQPDPPYPLARGHRFCGWLPILDQPLGICDRFDESILLPDASASARFVPPLRLCVGQMLGDTSARLKHERARPGRSRNAAGGAGEPDHLEPSWLWTWILMLGHTLS